MLINSSNVGMESERSYTSISKDATKKTTYTLGGKSQFSSLYLSYNSEKEYNGELSESKKEESSEENVEEEFSRLSIKEQMEAMSNNLRRITSAISNNATQNEDDLRAKMMSSCLDYLLRLLFGESYEDWLKCKGIAFGGDDTLSFYNSGSEFVSLENQIITIGTQTTEEHYFEEEETTSFSTKGKVRTEDGREIEFNLDLEMSRSFVEYTGISKESKMEFVDPLVINFNGNIADVSDQKFYFDLNADGEEEEISQIGSGSGFLALDKNEDGIINDGYELFGAKSGNGFADLSEYDEDNNGWIDEADSVFDKLIIWTKDEEGNDKQISLKEAGVGALYTGSSSTKFTLMGGLDKNQTLEEAAKNAGKVNAVIRSTGLFLYENGEVGTMQQVDMAKNVS